MRFRTALLAAATTLLGLVVTVAAATFAAGTPTPDARTAPPQPEAVDGVPAEVLAWYQTAASVVLAEQATSRLDLAPGEGEEAELGLVRTVSAWSPGLVAGTDLDPPVVAREEWISPVRIDGEGVGVLRAAFGDDGQVQVTSLEASGGLADAMLGLAPTGPVVHDDMLDAWFTVSGGEVGPLDDAARDALAGTVPIELYQPFVTERYSEEEVVQVPAGPSWVPAAWVGAVLAVLLAWAGLIVWLRRDNA
ncbi:hypothetical protein [Georgenia alba]|uniref:SURF1-like protein n=1 Tax=Georgenia alba TaxID=2233858 RepID=A0ABW2QBQ7_9MICO